MSLYTKLSRSTGPAAVILIRLMVGGVFLSEGIQKFLFANDVGAGRFARIGIPSPEVMGSFVGVVEVVCGTLILVGVLTRLGGDSFAHRYPCSDRFDEDSNSSWLWAFGASA